MAQRRRISMIDKLLSMRSVSNPRISPDGKRVAYTIQETDWEEDRFVSQIWIADVGTRESFQLTRGQKGAGGQQWSPDEEWLAFVTEREAPKSDSASKEGKPSGSKVAENQIWLISPSGGEAVRLTKSETNVSGFRWSPESSRIAFHAPAPESKALKERKEKYGEFETVDEDITMSQLWIIDVRTKRAAPGPGGSGCASKDDRL